MPKRWHRATLLGMLLIGGPAALAQANRPWVDPPSNLGAPDVGAEPQGEATAPLEPAPPARGPGPDRAARPEPAPQVHSARPPAPVEPPRSERTEQLPAHASAAQELAISYLEYWSASNPVTLKATPAFYAPRVAFHGRMMSARSLLEEKRRFVRRWPERLYRHRLDTMQVACAPQGETCTVRSVFDFTAANPKRRRHSQGTASLELVVSFASGRPVIVSENSLVRNRDRSGRSAAQEGE